MNFTMMPIKDARRRVWQVRRAGAPITVATDELKLSVHVSMETLEAEWRALETSPGVSLHQGYDWCRAWVQTHHNQVLLVRGRIGQRTVFILPLELVRGHVFRVARFIGAPHSNINTGIFAGDLDPRGFEQLARTLISDLSTILARVADLVTLEKMPLDWRGACHPLASLPSVRNQNSSFQLPLLESFEATLAQINAKRRRKKFRLSERRLQTLGGYEHVIAADAAESRLILSIFFQQKAVRFKALGLPNVFQDAPTQAFFHALSGVAPDDRGQPLQLHAIRLKGAEAGRIVAVAGLSRKGDHVICQFGSIDETLAADASPGELLFYLMIEKYCAQGVKLFDFGIGDQGYKRSWCTVETIQRDIMLPLTMRGRLAAWTHRLLVRSKVAIKKNRAVYDFVQRVRQRRQATAAPDAEAD